MNFNLRLISAIVFAIASGLCASSFATPGSHVLMFLVVFCGLLSLIAGIAGSAECILARMSPQEPEAEDGDKPVKLQDHGTDSVRQTAREIEFG